MNALNGYQANRKSLAAARQRQSMLAAKIDEAMAAECAATQRVPSRDEVTQRGEDLAAAEVLGQATAQELKELRAQLEKDEAAIAKGMAEVRAAQRARMGLERLHAQAQAEIENLETTGRSLLVSALRDLAIQVGAEYIKHARVVNSSFLRLMALDSLLTRAGGPSEGIAYGTGQKLLLPTFRLAGFEGLTHPNWVELFSESGLPLNVRVQQATKDEEEKLRKLGVEL